MLQSPFDCKEIKPVNPTRNQPWIFIGILEGLMLKLQSFGHLMRRADSLEKTRCWETLKTEGEGDNRGLDGEVASWTQWTWIWANSGREKRTGELGTLQSMELQSWTWLSDWTRGLSQKPIVANNDTSKSISYKWRVWHIPAYQQLLAHIISFKQRNTKQT